MPLLKWEKQGHVVGNWQSAQPHTLNTATDNQLLISNSSYRQISMDCCGTAATQIFFH